MEHEASLKAAEESAAGVGNYPRNVHVAAAASPRPVSGRSARRKIPKGYPRSPPRTIVSPRTPPRRRRRARWPAAACSALRTIRAAPAASPRLGPSDDPRVTRRRDPALRTIHAAPATPPRPPRAAAATAPPQVGPPQGPGAAARARGGREACVVHRQRQGGARGLQEGQGATQGRQEVSGAALV